MPTSMSTRSTLLAIAIAVLLLGATTAFVAFAPEDDEAGSGGGAGGDGLPEGFALIPEDLFVERVFGAQRAEGSWHMEQEKTVNGTPGTSIRLDTESGGTRTHASIQISREDGSTIPLQVVLVDGVYYAKAPKLFSIGNRWWKADPVAGEAQANAAATFEELLSAQTSDNLGDAVDEVQLVGPDTVEDITTAHYRLHLTQPVPAPPGAATPSPPEGQPEATIDIWVDRQDRPIRLVTTTELDGAEVIYTTTYSGYGASFGITAPPARQVTSEVPESER